jgi:nitrate reductase NapE component
MDKIEYLALQSARIIQLILVLMLWAVMIAIAILTAYGIVVLVFQHECCRLFQETQSRL